ncbi:MAG: zinc-binding alcohol dehydrogenase family protein [Planctomycetota bacterium]
MNTLVLEEPGRLGWREPHDPPLAPDEARVLVRRIGICGTDLHAYRGRQPFFEYPRVLGHELAVEVESVGTNGDASLVGRWCAVRPYINDPGSPASRRGKSNCCPSMRVLGVHIDGGMGSRLTLPSRLLHPVDAVGEEVSAEVVALAEPLAIGCHAVRRGDPQADESVLVIGAGPIGLAVLQFARLRSQRVTVLDLNERRLAFCRDRLGIADARCETDDGEHFDCVFDATGHPGSMRSAVDRVAHGGKLVYVGLHTGDVTFPDPLFHSREMTLLASRNATAEDFDLVLSELTAGRVDAESMITHCLTLDELPGAFESFYGDADLIKVVVEVPA